MSRSEDKNETPKLEAALKRLIAEHGQSRVKTTLKKLSQPASTGVPGAPLIDSARDAYVAALVAIMVLPRGGRNVKRACEWISRNVSLRLRDAHRLEWQRQFDNPEGLRRAFARERKRWELKEFSEESMQSFTRMFSALKSFLEDGVTHAYKAADGSVSFMAAMPSGLHIDTTFRNVVPLQNALAQIRARVEEEESGR